MPADRLIPACSVQSVPDQLQSHLVPIQSPKDWLSVPAPALRPVHKKMHHTVPGFLKLQPDLVQKALPASLKSDLFFGKEGPVPED